MDIRDFNSWLDFKEKCKERIEENCGLKQNGLCIFILCPLKKLDREFDDMNILLSFANRNNLDLIKKETVIKRERGPFEFLI